MESQGFYWFWFALHYLAFLTFFVSLLFAGVCLFDGPKSKMPRPRLVGFLSLWVALLSLAASVGFDQCARLAVK
jgi:hypothetical protein